MLIFSVFVFFSLLAQESAERKINTFTKLVVTDRINVRLVKADTESVFIKAQGIKASSVQTEVIDQVLTVRIYGEPFTKKKVTVILNYNNIKSITVNGGADVSTTTPFKADTLNVELTSGGMLYLNADISFLTGKINEGALLTAEGRVNHQDLTVSTSATLSAFNLISEIATIKASLGGKVKINVVKELHAEASSNAFISYKGNPIINNSKVTSGGTITAYKP
jgi:hypothetical protein